ncbi:MAG: metallophosphoesterase family protein, partial [Acidobacteria bacterium]|nr:metallophosphoesterase family protein [Acidobacteriota bacterium]
MRIAALYDIHANLPALEAVLAEVRQGKADRILIGGDVIPGPLPRETLDCLTGCEFVHGNGEVAVLDVCAGRIPVAVPEQYRPMIHWNAQQLTPEHQNTVATWPKTLRIDVPGVSEVLFCHATPRDENEIFTR